MHSELVHKRVAETNRHISQILSSDSLDVDAERKEWATRFGVDGGGPNLKSPDQVYVMQQELLAIAFEEITSLREEVEKLKATKANASAKASSK